MDICFLTELFCVSLLCGPLFACRLRGIPDAVTVRVKARAVRNKQWQRLDPAGGRWGIFGLHTVPDGATEVVLTEVPIGGQCSCIFMVLFYWKLGFSLL